MSRSQQIIAVHDAVSAGRSPADAIRAELEALSEGPPPAFIAVDARHPYPMSDLGPPDWLVTVVAFDEPASSGSGWRKVIEAAPQQTGVILLSYGEASDVPGSVAQLVDLTGWHGGRSDRRIPPALDIRLGSEPRHEQSEIVSIGHRHRHRLAWINED